MVNKSEKYVISKISDTYELDKFKRRTLLLFNTKYIRDYSPRHGTEQDVEALTKTFKNLEFDVNLFSDLIKDEIIHVLDKFSKQDFTDHGCLVVAVLTHGSDNGQLYAKDLPYNEMEIFERFSSDKVPTLAGKPKIFIVQACRGYGDTTGVIVWKKVNAVENNVIFKHDSETINSEYYSLPVESDMFILHSSHTGRPSFRNTSKGSWFIQSLCNQINKYWDKLDFESILLKVKREVALEYSHGRLDRRTDSIQFQKQMPVITSTLIRKLYFKKPIKEENYLTEKAVFGGATEDKIIEPSKNVNHEECCCLQYQQRFEYMKQCLEYYLEDYPNDSLAKCLFDICEEFKGPAFNGPKKAMIDVILKHLKHKNYENLKYMFTK